MALRFTVLASGSAGNAGFLRADGFGLLLDVGLDPQQLAARLAASGASWRQVDAVLLTHTHADHWHDCTLGYLRRLRIPLYCHQDHHATLRTYSAEFAGLLTDQLVRDYQEGRALELPVGLRCWPIPVLHDSGATFGFRLEKRVGLFAREVALAYVCDLGSWTAELAESLANVDVLALEFNHDVQMQYASGRSPRLIRRVLGDAGHLSNVQAAELLRAVLLRSEPGRLRHVVQLHLSQHCNRPHLARAAAQAVLADWPGITLHTARQEKPSPAIDLGERKARSRRTPRDRPACLRWRADYPWLPGFEP